MKVVIDGQDFELKAGTGVTRVPLVEFPQNIRLDGQQKRKDRSYLSSWSIDRWANGLGLEQMNVDLTAHQYRLWDVENVDTRWDNFLVLSPAFNTCTIVPSRGDLGVPFEYNNQLYFTERTRSINQSVGAGTLPFAYCFQFSVPNTLGSNIHLGFTKETDTEGIPSHNINAIYAVRPFGERIAILARGGTLPSANMIKYLMVATLGGPLQPANATLSSVPVLHTEALGLRGAEFGDFGGTLHLLEYRPSQQKVGFWVADRTLANFSQVASLNAQVGSYLPKMQTDGVIMFAGLPDGIYNFDATPDKVIDNSTTKDPNPQLALFQNELYFKNSYSLMQYDGVNLFSRGYDLNDGLSSDKWGQITALTNTFDRVFAAVKGATYAHILAMDTNHKWQYYARIPSPGLWIREMFLSNAPDAIDRLWCTFDNWNYPGYFLNPRVNPLQAATYSYVPTGYVRPPIYDGGMSDIPGAFFDFTVNGRAIDASNTITVKYGLEGVVPNVTLGIISTLTQQLICGSPYGVQGYRIQPEFLLTGATAGTTPQLNKAAISYLKDPDKREAFEFTLDLDETARQFAKPVEGIIGTLDTIRNAKTLVPFWYGQIGTKAVKVLDIPSNEAVEKDRILAGERSGFVHVRVAEII